MQRMPNLLSSFGIFLLMIFGHKQLLQLLQLKIGSNKVNCIVGIYINNSVPKYPTSIKKTVKCVQNCFDGLIITNQYIGLLFTIGQKYYLCAILMRLHRITVIIRDSTYFIEVIVDYVIFILYLCNECVKPTTNKNENRN